MSKRAIPFSPKFFILGCAASSAIVVAPVANAQTAAVVFVNVINPLSINSPGGSAGPVGGLAWEQWYESNFYNEGSNPNDPYAELIGVSLTLSSVMSFSQTGSVSGAMTAGTVTLSAAGAVSLVDAGVFTTAVTVVPEDTVTQSTGSPGPFGTPSSGTATYASPVEVAATGLTDPAGSDHGLGAPIQRFSGAGNGVGASLYGNDISSVSCGGCSLGAFVDKLTVTYVYTTYIYQYVPGPPPLAMFLPCAGIGLAAIRRRNRLRRD